MPIIYYEKNHNDINEFKITNSFAVNFLLQIQFQINILKILCPL